MVDCSQSALWAARLKLEPRPTAKTAIVTGGSRGPGRSTVLSLTALLEFHNPPANRLLWQIEPAGATKLVDPQ